MERTSNAQPKPRQVTGVFHKYSTTMVELLLLARRSSTNRKKRTKKWCWVNPLFVVFVGCVVVVVGPSWFETTRRKKNTHGEKVKGFSSLIPYLPIVT